MLSGQLLRRSIQPMYWLLVIIAVVFSLAGVASADGGPTERGAGAGQASVNRAIVIFDNFQGAWGISLEGRSPRVGPGGAKWSVELGNWVLSRSGLVEASPEAWLVASDKRAFIDAGIADVQVSAQIRHGGGQQFVGVVARYSGAIDWIGFWYDGHGDLVMGAKQSGSDGVFHELGRVSFDWRAGKQHSLELQVDGGDVTALVDGEEVMSVEDVEVLGDATSVGVFSRGNGDATFQNFRVFGLKRQDD